MNKTKLIVSADDYGSCESLNNGIMAAAHEGILTSTCIMANGLAYQHGKSLLQSSKARIGLGVHLNLIDGKSSRDADFSKSLICHPDGTFKVGFVKILLKSANKTFLEEVENEFRAQIATVMADFPEVDHINSHQHTHAIPALFAITCKLANEFGIKCVRIPREPLFIARPMLSNLRLWFLINIIKWLIINTCSFFCSGTARRHGLVTNSRFLGVLYTGFMDQPRFLAGAKACAGKHDSAEVLFHPSIPTGKRDEQFYRCDVRDYALQEARTRELSTICDTGTRERILADFDLATFDDLATPGNKALFGTGKSPAAARPKHPPLKVFALLDETPFYHPKYLRRLVDHCDDIEICGVAAVSLPSGGAIQKYLMKNWRELGIREFAGLAAKKVALQLKGAMPVAIRADNHSSVVSVCKERNIPVRRIASLKDGDFVEMVRQHAPDVILSSNSLIFNKEFLALPKYGCINRHTGALPSYGGLLPAFRALQAGEDAIGVSIHRMTPKIDVGDVLSRKWIPVFPEDNLDGLYEVAFEISFHATCEAFAKLRKDPNAEGLDNEGLEQSYFSFPNKEDWAEFRSNGGRFI